MLPNAATFYRATARDTTIPHAQTKPLDIGDKVWMNNPNRNQALSYLMATGRPTQPTYNHVFGHDEKSPFPNWVVYTGASESSQAVTGLTIDGVYERCAAGSLLMNTRTMEIMRLTEDPTGADTTGAVARDHGRGTAADLMNTGDNLLLLTPQMYEGFTTGKKMTGDGVYKSFRTGIASYPIGATTTEQTERTYAGTTPFEEDLDLTWIQVKDQMESGLFFMAGQEDSSTYDYNYHTYNGLYDFISTNVWNVAGTMSRMDFIDILLEHRIFYKGRVALLCSSFVKQMITEWAYGQMEYDQDAKTLGMDIQSIQISGYNYDLIEVDKFSQDPYLAGMIFICPRGNYQYRPLIWKGENNDVKYVPISRDEVHQKEGEIWGEYGHHFYLEETWGLVKGLQF